QDVHAEPPDAGHAPGAVVIAQSVETGAVLVAGDQVLRDRLGLLRRQAVLRQRHQLAVDAGAEHVSGLDVEVGRPAVDRRLDDLLDAARLPGGARTSAPAFFLSHSVSGL